MEEARTILYFDGVCNLCNKTVQWVLKNDKTSSIFFAPLQEHKEVQQQDIESAVLFHKGAFYYKSDAALKLIRFFGWQWQWMQFAYILPKFLRDKIYTFVAKRRYKWFGRKEECMLPAPDVKQRFLS